MDSGASHHLTADINALAQVTPIEGAEKITVGNSTMLPIGNIGSTTLKHNNHSFVLNKVLHVRNITRSLLSVKQLCADNRSWFICDESEFFVQDKKPREIVYQGKSRLEELFRILVNLHPKGLQITLTDPEAYLGKVVNPGIWHQRSKGLMWQRSAFWSILEHFWAWNR